MLKFKVHTHTHWLKAIPCMISEKKRHDFFSQRSREKGKISFFSLFFPSFTCSNLKDQPAHAKDTQTHFLVESRFFFWVRKFLHYLNEHYFRVWAMVIEQLAADLGYQVIKEHHHMIVGRPIHTHSEKPGTLQFFRQLKATIIPKILTSRIFPL